MGNSKFKKVATKVVAVSLSLTTAIWLSGAAMALPLAAKAATVDELMAQITALQAQVASMQAPVASSAYSYTRNLTVGSRGADVTALQDTLISGGYLKVSATGYFGALTKVAVKAWQAAAGLPSTGYFGPMSRAKVATVGGTPTSGTTPTPGITPTPGTTPVPTGTGLAVAVDASNPAAGSFPAGGSQIPFLKLKFTAGSADTTVTAMNVYRGGLSSDNDISNVYLMDGSSVLATNLGLSSGKAYFSLATGLFTVKAGTSRVVTVAADISATNTASHAYTFGVNSAADITPSAGVTGTFPMTGNTMTAVSVTNPGLATLTVASVSTGGSVNAGTTGFLAGQFSLQSANSAVSVKSVKLTDVGTNTHSSDISNIKLMNGGTQVGATIVNANSDGTVVFNLSSNPLRVASGQTINLSVYADVVGGVNRTLRFTVQHSYDVTATDMTYNVGAGLLGTYPVQASSVSISSGSLVVSKNAASPTNYIARGATNATLAKFDFNASGEAVRITAITYQVGTYSANQENAVWNNLKLVDDQGVQIGTTATAVSSDSVSTTQHSTALTGLNYIIPANTTRSLSIVLDTVSTYAGSMTGSITSITAQGYTSLTAIPNPGPDTSTHAGNALSASSNPFVASLNNGVGAISSVSGAQGIKIGSFALAAGAAEGVNVTSLTVKTGSAVSSQYRNLKVMVGSTQLGNTNSTLTDSTEYSVSASNIMIPVGGQIVVDVYADTVSGATSSAAAVLLSGGSANGASTNTTRTLTNSSGTKLTSSVTVTGQVDTITASGNLTDALAPSPVVSQQVAMGVTGVVLGTFKLSETTNSESIDVTSIVVNSTSTSANDIKNLRLMNGTTPVGSSVAGLPGSGAQATTFTIPIDPVTGHSVFIVPQNNYVTLSVVADTNDATGGAASNDTITVGLGAVTGQGHSSAAPANATPTSVDSSATFTLHRATMSVAVASGSYVDNSITDNKIVAKFSFTNSGNYDATIATSSIQQVGAAVTSTGVTFTFFDGDTNASIATTGAVTASTSAAVVTFSTAVTVAKNTTKTIIVKANLSTASYTYSNPAKSYAVNLTGFAWGDGSVTGISPDTSKITFPISGPSMSL
ncbi:MAG: peptidoglycan-binding protein [Parcubacteria group bacterium]|nr:peptidoglycan-binding protein [Parcubacteria group bacterium]